MNRGRHEERCLLIADKFIKEGEDFLKGKSYKYFDEYYRNEIKFLDEQLKKLDFNVDSLTHYHELKSIAQNMENILKDIGSSVVTRSEFEKDLRDAIAQKLSWNEFIRYNYSNIDMIMEEAKERLNLSIIIFYNGHYLEKFSDFLLQFERFRHLVKRTENSEISNINSEKSNGLILKLKNNQEAGHLMQLEHARMNTTERMMIDEIRQASGAHSLATAEKVADIQRLGEQKLKEMKEKNEAILQEQALKDKRVLDMRELWQKKQEILTQWESGINMLRSQISETIQFWNELVHIYVSNRSFNHQKHIEVYYENRYRLQRRLSDLRNTFLHFREANSARLENTFMKCLLEHVNLAIIVCSECLYPIEANKYYLFEDWNKIREAMSNLHVDLIPPVSLLLQEEYHRTFNSGVHSTLQKSLEYK